MTGGRVINELLINGRVINERIVFFEWTIPLSTELYIYSFIQTYKWEIQAIYHKQEANKHEKCLQYKISDIVARKTESKWRKFIHMEDMDITFLSDYVFCWWVV